MAASRLNSRVVNVFRTLCDETSVTPALLTGLGKMNPWWLRVGKHRDLEKRVLECFRLKDTMTMIESECCCRDGKPKDSLDQDTGSNSDSVATRIYGFWPKREVLARTNLTLSVRLHHKYYNLRCWMKMRIKRGHHG